jgi:hypothetical protein
MLWFRLMRNRRAGLSALSLLLFAVVPAIARGRPQEVPVRPSPMRQAAARPASEPVSAGVPRFSHVLIIIFENKEFSDVIGNPLMPNFNRMAGEYALLTQYHAVTHPSLPNYLALVAGDFFGITDDCLECYVDARSLPDLLEGAGRTWKTYVEGLPSAGFTGSFSGRYAKKHNPFVYFDDIRKDRARLERSVLPFDRLYEDLEARALPDYAFIVPDMCHSSHDCGGAVADAWVGGVAERIVRSLAFDASSLLALTFDEGTTDLGCCGSPPAAGGGRIATILVSPLVRPGDRDPTPYSHYSLLKTILAAWGLGDLGRTSDPAVSPIIEPWRSR